MENLKIRPWLILAFLALSLIPLFLANYLFASSYFSKEIFWVVAIVTAVLAILTAILLAEIITLAPKDDNRNIKLSEFLQKVESMQKLMLSQEKLASMGALSAGIMHEIKNPLNFINNFAQLCENQTAKMQHLFAAFNDRLNNEEKENINKLINTLESNVKKIRQHGLKANSIICNMLEQSRSGFSKEFQPTKINALLEEFFKLAFHAKKAEDSNFNIQMQMNFDENLCTIDTLPQEFGRVVLNLLNNAFYAVSEKKKTAGENYFPVVGITTKREAGDKISIAFYDNGIGIPQDIREKMYDYFFTTKPPEEGTGLGLALSREIVVAAHHGEINVESKIGEYTIFTIVLPCKQSA